MNMVFVLVAIIAYIIYFYYDYYKRFYRKGHKVLPGPLPLPLLSNIIQLARLDRIYYKAFAQIGEKYGPIAKIHIGSSDHVIINSLRITKDLFSMSALAGRELKGFLADRNMHRNLGLVLSNGDVWKTMRSFTFNNLREYGFGKKAGMEPHILMNVKFIEEKIEDEIKYNGGIIKMDDFFHTTSVSSLWMMMFGEPISPKDRRIQVLIKIQKEMLKTQLLIVGIVNAYPFLRDLFPKFFGRDVQMRCFDELRNLAMERLREAERKFPESLEPSNFAEAFIKKIREHKNDPDTMFTELQWSMIFADLVQAGSETTGTTLMFTIAYLVRNKPIQRKLQEEIDRIIGKDVPSLVHQQNMIYAQAVCLEVLRVSSILPVLVPHLSTEDIVYDGYFIPKGMVCISNNYLYSYDEKIWGDPETFRPERFISKDGEKIIASQNVIPFGVGKRVCFGEKLAEAQIFLYLTSLFQVFDFDVPPGEESPSVEPIVAATNLCRPFKVLVTPRLSNRRSSLL